jgi:quercetin dioxygenase-like cupin family protein
VRHFVERTREDTMSEHVLHRRGKTLVRRLRLAPGESTAWHRDPFHRVTVVLSGEALAIEYRDEAQGERFQVTAGQADWDEPTGPVHRAINVGQQAMKRSRFSFWIAPTPFLNQKPNSEEPQEVRARCFGPRART